MKRTSIVFFITFLVFILTSACQENTYMDWKIMNDNWYAAHKNDPGFVTTSSGLCYKVINQGVQRFPNINSHVIVSYKGTLIDGSVFDSTAVGTSVDLSLSGTVPGWQEGLSKMQSGGNYIFYIPYKLGYNTATDEIVPPYTLMKFNVHLINSYN